MTTLTAEDGAYEVITARRTESLDAPHILRLVQPWTEDLFGRVNVVNIIEKAVLAVTLINENEEIFAHAAFYDYPNFPQIGQSEWESWMSIEYLGNQYTALNSLFMHYFVAREDYAKGCVAEIVRTAFNAVPDVHFIFLVVPQHTRVDPAIATVFKFLEKRLDSQCHVKSSIFVCHRHIHVPVLHIRQARVQDHDDLIPLFSGQSDMLKATYGDYFLAELIEAQDEHMQCLVAEVDGVAVGFMSITDDVNFNLLNECFELGPSHGLRKPHADDVTSPEHTPVMSPQPEPEEDIHKTSSSKTSLGSKPVEDVTSKEEVSSSRSHHDIQHLTDISADNQRLSKSTIEVQHSSRSITEIQRQSRSNTEIPTPSKTSAIVQPPSRTHIDIKSQSRSDIDMQTPSRINTTTTNQLPSRTDIDMQTPSRTTTSQLPSRTDIDMQTPSRTTTSQLPSRTDIDMQTPSRTTTSQLPSRTNIDMQTPSRTTTSQLPSRTDIDMQTPSRTTTSQLPSRTNIDMQTPSRTTTSQLPSRTNIDMQTPSRTNTDIDTQLPIKNETESVTDVVQIVVPKLSDAQMGEISFSMLSETKIAEIVKTLMPHSLEEKQDQPPSRTTPLPPEPVFPKRFVPQYNGEPNAFSMQLFCIDEKYEMRSCDFLPEAFSLFPHLDFCIATIPHLVPEFPLLQHFVRITPRSPSTLPQELYVFHRSGLLGDFKVRPACVKDVPAIGTLVKTIQLNEIIMQDLDQFNKARRDADGTEIQAYVAECEKQIVGVAIIRREKDIEYIRSHYNIEDFIYFNHHRQMDHGHLHHLALNPIFNHLTKHFLKEILRLGHKTCLYYPLYPVYSSKEDIGHHTLICCLGAMVPVRARRQIKYPLEQLGINAPSERILTERKPYALNHINRKLTLEPKVTINARIVVVGASDVAISFLETLAYCPHLRFNNLTLISPHGMPGEMPSDPQRDQMLPSSLCYNQEDYAKVALRTWVNVVYGRMTAINRQKKFVVVDGNFEVPYNHLVLSTGQQFQAPAPTGADIYEGATNETVSKHLWKCLRSPLPKNLFLVNDAYDAAVALYKAQKTMMEDERPIIVYGSNISSHCCIQSLLTLGIAGTKIILVHPPLEEPCYEDHQVVVAVSAALQEIGVQVYSGYFLARWNDLLEIPEEITCATFTSLTEPLRLECQAFFSFFKKAVNLQAFKAINDSYLVYDGKLVIDASFHTNDVTIRGAGPLTKFQRRYQADQWTHACFNSKEVGISLATEMLRLFDPTLEPQPGPPPEPLNLIPVYRSPRIASALLPGGFHYLEVVKPGVPDPPELQLAQSRPGREIWTGDPSDETGYMKLGINQYQTVDKIVCLSKKPFPIDNLICLYGVHQRILNNLLSRYDEGLIKDFYSFLQESWCLAVYHDRFSDFRDEIRELLVTSPGGGREALETLVRQVVDEEVEITQEQRRLLLEYYTSSGSKRAVDTRLLSFLAYNYYHLPMYAKPGMV